MAIRRAVPGKEVREEGEVLVEEYLITIDRNYKIQIPPVIVIMVLTTITIILTVITIVIVLVQ